LFGGFEVFVAKRYLLTRKKTGFISIISVISVVGITIGVAALIIVLSLMNGFSKELRTRLIGMDGHIWVSRPFDNGLSDYEDVLLKLKDLKGVKGASPYCSYTTVGIDRDGSNPAQVMVRGVQNETVDSVSEIRHYVRYGGSLDFSSDENDIPGAVLGVYLARTLGYAEVGDYVYIYGPGNINAMLDTMTPPPLHKFRVTGIFESGYYDYDNAVMLIGIMEAQKILGFDEKKVSGIVLTLEDMFQAAHFSEENGFIDKALGGYPYSSLSWIEQNQVLFRWMKLEKWAAFIVLSLIILVAAFNIISSLTMLVMDKTREVGILKSMGATNKSIERIFVYQGAFVGVCGTLLGSVIGIVLCYLQDRYQFISFPGEIYFISALPMDLQMRDTGAITIVTLFLCWLSSFYPAKKAAKLDPVEAIRAE
jgi:lipoprotein-releasing system permease protein